MDITVQVPNTQAAAITAAVGLEGATAAKVTAAVQEWVDETVHAAKVSAARTTKTVEADTAVSALGESPRQKRIRLAREAADAARRPPA